MTFPLKISVSALALQVKAQSNRAARRTRLIKKGMCVKLEPDLIGRGGMHYGKCQMSASKQSVYVA